MRRVHLLAFAGVCLAAAAVVAADAFTSADLAPREVVVRLVADDDAYLALAANPSSPHACFVSTAADGRLAVHFGPVNACAASGGGSGINGGSGTDTAKRGRYAFHDLVLVSNHGVKSVRVWVNATTTSGLGSSLDVAAKPLAAEMGAADYSPGVGPFLLAPGDVLYLGLRVDSGQLTAPATLTGAVTVEARTG